MTILPFTTFKQALAAFKHEVTADRAISDSDGPGSIYGFVEEGRDEVVIKVGYTQRDLEARRKEWDERCTEYEHAWFEGIPVVFAKRTERLVHLSLEASGFERLREACSCCGVTHIEKFRFIKRGDWKKVVVPLIKETNLCLANRWLD